MLYCFFQATLGRDNESTYIILLCLHQTKLTMPYGIPQMAKECDGEKVQILYKRHRSTFNPKKGKSKSKKWKITFMAQIFTYLLTTNRDIITVGARWVFVFWLVISCKCWRLRRSTSLHQQDTLMQEDWWHRCQLLEQVENMGRTTENCWKPSVFALFPVLTFSVPVPAVKLFFVFCFFATTPKV